jgi:hypothetical protein
VFTNAYLCEPQAHAHCRRRSSLYDGVLSVMHVHFRFTFVYVILSMCIGVRNSEKILSVLVRYEH